jgi:SAM-dependent methyltransferase
MRLEQPGVAPYRVDEGRAEDIHSPGGSFDAVIASLSLMYAVDRQAAAREIARVLRPSGRLVASVWGGPDECDLVLFQETAGSFAPEPPVHGVGPGALADPASFLAQLARSGIEAKVESEISEFEFPNFAFAWEVLSGVTTRQLAPERREEAQDAVRAAMWPEADEPQTFRNTAHFIVGRRSG